MCLDRPRDDDVVTTSDWKAGLPVLAGSNFTLRELRLEDAPSLLAMLTTEEVARFISPPPTTVEGFERFIRGRSRSAQAGNYACFAVVPDGIDAAIGIFQVRSLEPRLRARPNGASRSARSSGARACSPKGARLVVDFAVDVIGVAPPRGARGRGQRPRQRRAPQDRRRPGRRAAPLVRPPRRASRPGAVVAFSRKTGACSALSAGPTRHWPSTRRSPRRSRVYAGDISRVSGPLLRTWSVHWCAVAPPGAPSPSTAAITVSASIASCCGTCATRRRLAQSHPEVDRRRRCARQRRAGRRAPPGGSRPATSLRVRFDAPSTEIAAGARNRSRWRCCTKTTTCWRSTSRRAWWSIRRSSNTPGTLMNGRAGARARVAGRFEAGACWAGSTSSRRASSSSPSAAEVHAALQRAMDARRVDKDYLAIVWGKPSPPGGTIDLALDRDPWDRRRITVTDRGGQPSVTRYERLSTSRRVFTGALPADHRPHASDSRPPRGEGAGRSSVTRCTDRRRIAADAVEAAAKFPRQALHAWRLAFRQPTNRHASSRSRRRCRRT